MTKREWCRWCRRCHRDIHGFHCLICHRSFFREEAYDAHLGVHVARETDRRIKAGNQP